MNDITLSKVNELEELIELAEKVSSNIDVINSNIKNSSYKILLIAFTFLSLFLFGFTFYEMQDYNFHNKWNKIAPIFSFIGIFIIVSVLNRLIVRITNMKKEVKNENLILEDLLSMIHSYKQVTYKDISLIKKAVIDMRLKRIKFNKQSSKKLELLKKEEIVTV